MTKKIIMTQEQSDFLNRIHEKANGSRIASFSYAELFGSDNPAFKDVCRIRNSLYRGMRSGLWTFTVERFGRKCVTYHFKPLIKVIREE